MHEARFIKKLRQSEKCNRNKVNVQSEKLQSLKRLAKQLTIPGKGIIDLSLTFDALKKKLFHVPSSHSLDNSRTSREFILQEVQEEATSAENFDKLGSMDQLFKIGDTLLELLSFLEEPAQSPKHISFEDEGNVEIGKNESGLDKSANSSQLFPYSHLKPDESLKNPSEHSPLLHSVSRTGQSVSRTVNEDTQRMSIHSNNVTPVNSKVLNELELEDEEEMGNSIRLYYMKV